MLGWSDDGQFESEDEIGCCDQYSSDKGGREGVRRAAEKVGWNVSEKRKTKAREEIARRRIQHSRRKSDFRNS